MGIQTGSQRIRNLYNRPESNDQVLAAAQCLHRFRKWIPDPRYDLISDNPYETHADHLETLRLLYQLPRPSRFHFFSLTFYPGTGLYEQATADGLIQDDEREVYCKNYAQLEPNYYSFVLWCFHRNLPRWLLWALIRPLSLGIFSSRSMNWLFHILWKVIETVRIRYGRHTYLQLVSRLALNES